MHKKQNFLSVFLNGLIVENPTFVLMLGMCPTLGITTAAMNVSNLSASRCISAPRLQTRRNPVCRSNIPLTVAATTSPREKPATTSGVMPLSISTDAAASSIAKRPGWVFRVSFSSSSVPAKH